MAMESKFQLAMHPAATLALSRAPLLAIPQKFSDGHTS